MKHPITTRAVKFALRRSGLEELRAAANSDKELADLIGVTISQFYKILAGTHDPGIRFVAGIYNAFGADKLADIFHVVPEADDKAGAA